MKNSTKMIFYLATIIKKIIYKNNNYNIHIEEKNFSHR